MGIPCSLSIWGLVHRHESHTWSLERTESLTSDSQSGIMLSSVGTSKCNSPACVEARARRGAAFCIEDSRRPMTQYRDSVDSLRDSPHSERSDPTAWCRPGRAEASHALCAGHKNVCLCPALEQQSCGSTGETPALVLPQQATTPRGHSGRCSSKHYTLLTWWQHRFGAQG